MTPEISLESLLNATANGIFFSVKFVKRTNGEVRDMLCRRNVKKYLRGGKLAYNPLEKNLLTVFDMRISDYRCINLEGIIHIKLQGKFYNLMIKETENGR